MLLTEQLWRKSGSYLSAVIYIYHLDHEAHVGKD